MKRLRIVFPVLIVSLLACDTFAQTEKRVPVCRVATFSAFKPLPKLEYECPDNPNDSDDAILQSPQRRRAIRSLMLSLERFTNAAWWQAGIDELNACQIHGRAGSLTNEEKEEWRSGDHSLDLFGNSELRLALIADPCYQTGYNGSNAFLLYRKDGRVYVSQLLNGYYSRIDNSVGIDFAKFKGEQIIEISTANNMPPSMVYYYFAIDPKTNKAVPKKIFKEGKKLTNEIYSDMLMEEPQYFGLPATATELNIIVKGSLAPSFSAYEESENGRLEFQGRKLRRIVYHWNGRFYARTR